MKTKILLIALIAFVTAGMAQTATTQQNGLQDLKKSYNQQTNQVPGFLGNIIGGETININLETNQSTQTLGVKFDGLKIENISNSEMENPTMKANVSQQSITSVVSSEKPYEKLQEELKSEGIEYETTTVEAGIKLKIVETLGGIASALGLSF